MHVKFYHRVCFQSTWRGGCEGGEHYYSPPGVSPPLTGHHHTAVSQMGWTRPGPSSPGRERDLVTPGAGHCWTCPPLPTPALPDSRSPSRVPPRTYQPLARSEPLARSVSMSSPSLWSSSQKITSWRQKCVPSLFWSSLCSARGTRPSTGEQACL